MGFSDLAWQFLHVPGQRVIEGDIYERYYYWLQESQGLTKEKAESETATFKDSVADLLD
ncbi:hypothetical protein [Cohnella silvisoli]|uniref:Uncharacterized protein n=1 Tax=Cohnella silvisoli TaxID=2873699 RepID=A0ABV1KY41_9BACL|nr:hypothetical protein [Cohnella silvisoli]MCD9021891.1 hypothetical protein [Cohnella silvisoli]